MKDLFKITNIKCNLSILNSVEALRIALDTKKGNKLKVENHKRHQMFLIEIAETVNDFEKDLRILTTRNAELNYANTRLQFELREVKKQNKNLVDGL